MNTSSLAILSHNSLLGGGAPVLFHNSRWPSSSSIMSESIRLARALRSAGADFGMAQPQMSFQAIGSWRVGAGGEEGVATFPGALGFVGRLSCAQVTSLASRKGAIAAMHYRLGS